MRKECPSYHFAPSYTMTSPAQLSGPPTSFTGNREVAEMTNNRARCDRSTCPRPCVAAPVEQLAHVRVDGFTFRSALRPMQSHGDGLKSGHRGSGTDRTAAPMFELSIDGGRLMNGSSCDVLMWVSLAGPGGSPAAAQIVRASCRSGGAVSTAHAPSPSEPAPRR